MATKYYTESQLQGFFDEARKIDGLYLIQIPTLSGECKLQVTEKRINDPKFFKQIYSLLPSRNTNPAIVRKRRVIPPAEITARVYIDENPTSSFFGMMSQLIGEVETDKVIRDKIREQRAKRTKPLLVKGKPALCITAYRERINRNRSKLKSLLEQAKL